MGWAKLTRPADLPKEYLKDIGERIRRQRKFRELTQEEVSSLLGVTPNFYSKVERGLHGLSYDSLIELSKILGVSVDYILTGKVASDISSPILDIINTAPIDKRIYLEQILFYASQLYENDQAEGK